MYISGYWNCFSLSGKHILVDVLVASVQLQLVLCIAVVFDVSSFFLFYFFYFFIYTKVRAAFNKMQLHMNWSCFLLNAAHSQLELRLINAAPISSAFFFFFFFSIYPKAAAGNTFKRSFGASGAAFGKNAAQTGRWSCVCVKCSSNTTFKLRFCQTQLQNAAPCSVFCSDMSIFYVIG